MLNSKECSKYLFMAAFAAILYVSYLLAKPFFSAIIASAIMAYMFYPLYERLNKKLKYSTVSAILASILIIVILATPLFFLMNSITTESQVVYLRTRQLFITGDVFLIGCDPEATGKVCEFSNYVSSFLEKPEVRYHIEEGIKQVTSSASSKASAIIFSIPTILLNVFITLFMTFYFFKDGKKIIEKVKSLMPLTFSQQKQMFHQLNETTYAIIYGTLLIAAVQGAVAALGFFIFGVSSPITWGIVTAIFALVPFVGTAFVWLPISLLMIVQGFVTSSDSAILRGFGLLIFSAVVVASMDNLLKPFVIGKKAKIHPVLVLIGVLGGIALFGFIGFIAGPLVLALLNSFLNIYEQEKNHCSAEK